MIFAAYVLCVLIVSGIVGGSIALADEGDASRSAPPDRRRRLMHEDGIA